MARKPVSTTRARAKAAAPPPAVASVPDEARIRERAYGIWIEEGRPHGSDLAHWRRAHEELQSEAR
jgi:hypothetical protein